MKHKKSIFRIGLMLCLLLVLSACDKTTSSNKGGNSIARVNDKYLTTADLNEVYPMVGGSADSISFVKQYINKWATKELLKEAAEFNLSDDKVDDINELVKQFKDDLLIKAYLDKLVQQKVDTVVSEEDLKTYYGYIKDKFLADDVLVKMAYVNILNDNSHFNKVQRLFSSNKKGSYKDLEKLSLQLTNYALNDSIWVNGYQLYDKLSFLNSSNKNTYLKNNYYFEVSDENSTYFVRVKEVLNRGAVLPYDYLKPSLKQMVINERKMKMIKQIETDILNDAKKDKSYEVFK